MNSMVPIKQSWWILCALVVGGCRSAPAPAGVGGGGGDAQPAASEASESVYAYLTARYDADGDGVVTAAEYGRDGAAFARLDRARDGVLTPEDFVAAGRRVLGSSPAEARRLRALHLLGWYFQSDGRPESVDVDELVAAHEAYDADGNGRVGRREFERLAPSRAGFGRRPAGRWAGLLEVETTDPWERIVRGVDSNVDSFLSAAELAAFHRANAGEWTFAAEDVFAPDGPAAGAVAPDFTLAGYDGGGAITLSSFAGERPVALIFGSYT